MFKCLWQIQYLEGWFQHSINVFHLFIEIRRVIIRKICLLLAKYLEELTNLPNIDVFCLYIFSLWHLQYHTVSVQMKNCMAHLLGFWTNTSFRMNARMHLATNFVTLNAMPIAHFEFSAKQIICWYKFTYLMTNSEGPRSVGLCQLIWICTVCQSGAYLRVQQD